MNDQAIASQRYVLLLIAMFVKITIILASLSLSFNCLVPKTMNAGRAAFIAFCTILTSFLINFYGLAYGMLLRTVSSPHCMLIWYFVVFYFRSDAYSFIRLLPFNNYRFRRGHGLRTRLDRISRAQARNVCTVFLQTGSSCFFPQRKLIILRTFEFDN
jgi:hypothetical protein